MKNTLLCMLIISASIFADWNGQLDEKTQNLWEQFSCFQTKESESLLKFFVKVRQALLEDESLVSDMLDCSKEQKFLLFRPKEKVVLKKRVPTHLQEPFVWELSQIFGFTHCVVPSFLVEIGKKKVILQPMESFTFSRQLGELPSKSRLKKVLLQTYWEAHLCAYLLGLGDMVGRNIGVTRSGNIRFFDVESCFRYQNTPKSSGCFFKTGFVLQSLEWPQYRQALDEQTAQALRSAISELTSAQEKLDLYLQYRPLYLDRDGFSERLKKLQEFDFAEGRSFRDFYGFLYPKLSPGLDKLASIVSKIMEQKVDHGTALLGVSRRLKKYKISSSQKKELQKWVDEYVN
jgi:hypothetical protein